MNAVSELLDRADCWRAIAMIKAKPRLVSPERIVPLQPKTTSSDAAEETFHDINPLDFLCPSRSL